MSQYRKMGSWFLEKGHITEAQLSRVLEVQRASRARFGEVLVSLGYVTEIEVAKCLAEQFDFPIADLKNVTPSPEAMALLPVVTALSCMFLPVSIDEQVFEGIIADPLDIQGTDMIGQAIGRRLKLSIAPPTALHAAIVKHYGLAQAPKSGAQGTEAPKRKRRVKIDEQLDRTELLKLMPTSGGTPRGLVEFDAA